MDTFDAVGCNGADLLDTDDADDAFNLGFEVSAATNELSHVACQTEDLDDPTLQKSHSHASSSAPTVGHLDAQSVLAGVLFKVMRSITSYWKSSEPLVLLIIPRLKDEISRELALSHEALNAQDDDIRKMFTAVLESNVTRRFAS